MKLPADKYGETASSYAVVGVQIAGQPFVLVTLTGARGGIMLGRRTTAALPLRYVLPLCWHLLKCAVQSALARRLGS